MSIQRKAKYILEQAQVLARNVKSWADFSVAIFDQHNGLVAKNFQKPMEREAFYDSKEYEEVNQILLGLMKKFGVEGGATPQKSGRFVVRVPKTVHVALEIEAKREGVSLNQLAVSKLSLPLSKRLNISTSLIAEAFSRVHDGYAVDRVVVDPNLNALFLAACRSLGLNQSDYDLNHALFDIRKSKKEELPKTTKRTELRDYDEYQFATEIAIRILQRTKAVTLDQVLCDPVIAMEFDQIAQQLAPGQSALKLRCAALSLRKTHRLGPSKLKKVPKYDLVSAGPLQALIVPEIPAFPGAYVLYDHNRPIYASETGNLRKRVELHLEGGLPRWLEAEGGFDLTLKYSALAGTAEERRTWLTAFVLREKPLLNFQKVA
jgi:HicB family